MRILLPLLLVAALLAGCASDSPASKGADGQAAPGEGGQSPGGRAAYEKADVLRFASGDYEGELVGTVTFPLEPPTVCIQTCESRGEEVDLSSIIPAEAPVELTVDVDANGYAFLEYIDAGAVREEQESSGTGTQISAVLTRAAAGQVILHISSNYGLPVLPGTETSAYEARSAVRADRLVPYMPAALKLAAGDVLNVTGDIDEAILIAPDGTPQRVDDDPFLLTAEKAGEHILLVLGDDAAQVQGPNVTLAARRIVHETLDVHPLAAGVDSKTTWTVDLPVRPLLVSVAMGPQPQVSEFSAAPGYTKVRFTVTSPTGATVIDEGHECIAACGFTLLSSGGTYASTSSEFLDPGLGAGAYTFEATYTGEGMQAWAGVTRIA